MWGATTDGLAEMPWRGVRPHGMSWTATSGPAARMSCLSRRAEQGPTIGRPLAILRSEANAGAEEDRIRPARAVVVDVAQALLDKPVDVGQFADILDFQLGHHFDRP